MKIVLATPLYPPEIAEPAPYVKELAKRLTKSHEVVIVAYVRLPEPIPGVRIRCISKSLPLPIRMGKYFLTVLKEARNADLIFAMNGASVELPVLLTVLLTHLPLYIRIADRPAHERARRSALLRAIESACFKRARTIFTESPLPRPEILPLDPEPREALAAYERSWEEHVSLLGDAFHV